MNLRNNILVIYQTAEEIGKHVSKPKSFGVARVQNITDKI